jgi:hypothetical protein
VETFEREAVNLRLFWRSRDAYPQLPPLVLSMTQNRGISAVVATYKQMQYQEREMNEVLVL